ncbi:MAG: V-type ATP synthase subunit E [Desulfomonilia bacterium]|jgi:vacuolar-type H+-ATPase subunit E/Vma4|uniref:V-type proton ATPase subunit E n=1 Tax=anaerobic digester metagenome TaxID=1263854 RepID=A0A485LZP4_9ZZZZ|nr:V-type ATP synthase subunit E [Pseudomonadota bacterium]HPD21652.1 V-type ATP synthase subunit E [Deltaproteobacteria bacterium]HPX18310.1 V-type ATP synthase subunit E [Deltaproteobacteria bacterium]HRS56523.1 V-type ATP synthase subunit E [Desulfomonilia bacterium]HRV35484.1 V-type ATP synthase subunit E [Desulfomonilia bacterium]
MEVPNMREAILSKARQEAQELVEEARSRAAEMVLRAEEQWRQRFETEKQRLLSDSRREAARIIAQAELKARQELLKEKDDIIKEMIGRVRQRLIGNTTETGTLSHLIGEAVDAFQSDEPLKIKTAGKDIQKVREIISCDPKLKERIAEVQETACMGGIICESVDGKVSVDNTYDTRLEMLIPKLMPRVGDILFGDGRQ